MEKVWIGKQYWRFFYFITYEDSKVYLMYDSVHLLKNVRNNLLNERHIIYLLFIYEGLKDDIVSWRFDNSILKFIKLCWCHCFPVFDMLKKNCCQNIQVKSGSQLRDHWTFITPVVNDKGGIYQVDRVTGKIFFSNEQTIADDIVPKGAVKSFKTSRQIMHR